MYSVIRSDEYLEHHGIKGMRWGIWNDETRERYAGFKNKAKKRIKESTVKEQAAVAAGTMATISAIQTAKNFKVANELLDDVARIPMSTAITKGTVQAGKVALVSALAVVGGHMIHDYMKVAHEKDKQQSISKTNAKRDKVFKEHNISSSEKQRMNKIADQLTSLRNDKEKLNGLVNTYKNDYDIIWIPYEERYILAPR